VATKSDLTEAQPTDSTEAPASTIAAASLEHVLRASPDAFRAALQHISPAEDPGKWAAEQLKLGAVLRLRAQREFGSKRTQTFRQTIEAFEAALCVYCRNHEAAEEPHRDQASTSDPGKREKDVDPVDLVLEVTRGPFVTDTEALDEAIELLRVSCSRDIQRTDFNLWVVNMINLGCTLALMGKCTRSEGGAGDLEEAIDTFRAILSEPQLLEIPYERAIVQINMADALGSMGEIASPDLRVEYLESAASSLAMALSLLAPERLRCLVQADPVSFV
jgi:hypothetical protein